MANRRYDDPRRFEGRGQSDDELQRLRRGPHEDMRPGSREEWEQNREDYERAQEAVRTRGPGNYRDLREDMDRTGRTGREYARGEGPFYDELREEREHPFHAGTQRPTSLLYDTTDWETPPYGQGRGGPSRPYTAREEPRRGALSRGRGPERGRRGLRGFGELDVDDMRERLRREALRREPREPQVYDARYGPVYGHGPGVENMDPPFTGFSTSYSRADDHETGHGRMLGAGNYGRRDVPKRPRGKGPKGYNRSDERIREDICERLMDAWMNAEDVEVRVKDGLVTLVGSVRTRDEKHAMENLAADVLGVKDVTNSLLVERGGARVEPDSRRPVEPPDDTLHS